MASQPEHHTKERHDDLCPALPLRGQLLCLRPFCLQEQLFQLFGRRLILVRPFHAFDGEVQLLGSEASDLSAR